MDFAMQYGVDIALLAVLIFEIIWNASQGFMRTVLTLLAAIVAIGLAVKVAEPVASWSYDTFLDETVCEKLDEHASELADAKTTKEVVVEVARVIPDYLNRILERINVDLNETGERIGTVESGTGLTAQQISQQVVKPAAMVVLKTACTILCYILFMAVFRLLIHLICTIAKLPVLRTADKTLGGVLGFLKGLVLVYLIAMLCGLVGQITSKQQAKQVIDNSRIVKVCQQIKIGGDNAAE